VPQPTGIRNDTIAPRLGPPEAPRGDRPAPLPPGQGGEPESGSAQREEGVLYLHFMRAVLSFCTVIILLSFIGIP
jgi:hypothetical protein